MRGCEKKLADLTYAIVGIGPRSRAIRAAINKKMKLRSIFDPDPEVKHNFSGKGIQICENYDELLSSGVDTVIIASPPQFHAEQSIKALKAGIHVFCEVPMAIKEENIQKIIDADENNLKTKYMLGEDYCYDPDVLYSSHLVSSGKFGPIVYAEHEYIHDVSYRWRGDNTMDYKNTPKVKSWYSLFDPLAYAHTILPAQFAMGGQQKIMKFEKVSSYANNIGGEDGNPVCSPAKAFHVGLFKTTTNAICKCIAAYVYARAPTRHTHWIVGRFGSIESVGKGKKAKIFLADGFNIKKRNRVGQKSKMNNLKYFFWLRSKGYSPWSKIVRTTTEWLNSIKSGKDAFLNARNVANSCAAGLAAGKSAEMGKPIGINLYDE